MKKSNLFFISKINFKKKLHKNQTKSKNSESQRIKTKLFFFLCPKKNQKNLKKSERIKEIKEEEKSKKKKK